MFMFQEARDASSELTSPIYEIDVQSFTVSIDLSGFVDATYLLETAEPALDLLPVTADPVVPLTDPAATDPLVPVPSATTPVTVADLPTTDTPGTDTPVDPDAGAIADAVADALATLDGSFFDLASFSDFSFGLFS